MSRPHLRTREGETSASVRDGIEVALLDGNDDLDVVGESYYQENLWRLVGPRWPDERVRQPVYAVLIAEDDNPLTLTRWRSGCRG
jgi:hypothetical protein